MTDDTTPWQLFPNLADDEYEALKADIAERGVLVPVEYDEHGNILDGHHRVRACGELGIKDWPTVTRGGMDDEAKAEHVLTLNLSRRHLTREQRRELVKKLRIERGWSLPRIAERLGVSYGTVQSDAKQAVSSDNLPPRIEGSDGKSYAPTKPKPSPSIFTTSTRQQERAGKALLDLGADAPAKAIDVKRAERMAREHAAEQRRQQPTEPSTQHGMAEFRHGDFREALHDLTDVDAIITDPPYPREFIDLFGDLGKLAEDILSANGVLAVMVGQSHLRDYLRLLDEHMEYRWVGSYIVQGPRNRVHKARVGTGWKPILLYQRPGATPNFLLDDLFDSSADDKRHHHWGQSESGMASIIERLTEPGQLVVDPFLGGGTTGIVARDLGRRFVGCDIDAAAVHAARERAA